MGMNNGWSANVKAVAVCAIALFVAACSSNNLLPPAGVPVVGAWGGEHIRIGLNETGGSVEYDCAHGGISEGVRPDKNGNFDVAGVFVREHGGPVRQDEVPDSVPARYIGSILGSHMTLQVKLETQTLGPYVLAKGADARVFKCL